jgi:hypothetical protein
MSNNRETPSLESLKTRIQSETLTSEQKEQLRIDLQKLPLAQQIDFWRHVDTLNNQAKQNLSDLRNEMGMIIIIEQNDLRNILQENEELKNM